jgi:excisionase family DNA binding protein
VSDSDLEQLLAAYPDTLTVADVAAVLRVNERSVQRWAREGRLSSVRVGRSYRFLRIEVLRWMQSATIPDVHPHDRSEKTEQIIAAP